MNRLESVVSGPRLTAGAWVEDGYCPELGVAGSIGLACMADHVEDAWIASGAGDKPLRFDAKPPACASMVSRSPFHGDVASL